MDTIAADLAAAAARDPDGVAVDDGHGRLTYAELARAAAGLATGLWALGVPRGGRVALVLRNSCDGATAVYGTACAGAAVVPLDPTVPAGRLADLLERSGALVVICDAGTAPRVRAAAARCPRPPAVVVTGPTAPGDLSMKRMTTLEPEQLAPPLPVDLAAILYTSGSTGMPKGATFLHRNVHFVAGAVLEYLGMRPSDRVLSVLPLSHTYGLYQLLMSVRVGATLHLRIGSSALPGDLLQVLRREQITVLPGVPTLWHLLAAANSVDLPDVRLLTNAGAALQPDRVLQLRRLFPAAELFLMYGQTECNRVCFLPSGQADRVPDSVGIAIPGTEAWVQREDGTEAGPGETGELLVRGDHVMQGYWDDVEQTATKIVPGGLPGDRVLRTGDLFRRDDKGFLYFVARTDDVITTRGEKVAPLEVERVLGGAAGVCEVAVVGVPDDRAGERVVAHVSPLPGAVLEARALRRHCAVHLEEAKVPAEVVLHDQLPRLDNGKVDRMALLAGGAVAAARGPAR